VASRNHRSVSGHKASEPTQIGTTRTRALQPSGSEDLQGSLRESSRHETSPARTYRTNHLLRAFGAWATDDQPGASEVRHACQPRQGPRCREQPPEHSPRLEHACAWAHVIASQDGRSRSLRPRSRVNAAFTVNTPDTRDRLHRQWREALTSTDAAHRPRLQVPSAAGPTLDRPSRERHGLALRSAPVRRRCRRGVRRMHRQREQRVPDGGGAR
jgi:hypothetical protein